MNNHDQVLPYGAYETPITERVKQRIEATRGLNPSAFFARKNGDSSSAPDNYIASLSRSFARMLEARLSDTKNADDRIALINSLARHLGEDEMVTEEELLLAVAESELLAPKDVPVNSFANSALFTNSTGETNLATEINREIRTTDSVDLLCAFIKTSGIAAIAEQLEYLRDKQIPFRVLTSTYCGATETRAVRKLVEEYGAEVRVCYEHQTTRLHAKAWLFRRKSGFDTAFIGSSNLSRSALVDGWEWNIRGTSQSTPEIISKFIKTFDGYWYDNHFKEFLPDRDAGRLTTALQKAKGLEGRASDSIELSGLRVEPYPYQQEMLESLQSEREVKGHHRNLLVAATGTGKTVVAALDYRGLVEKLGRRPRLLFVAHRKEILEQARRTYREVLGSSDFGELMVGGNEPTKWDFVFSSVQSLKRNRLEQLKPDYFDVVVVDEFHHAEAPTYRRILEHFEPVELLGLTATPERADGENVQKYFDYRVAHELRLWDALHLQLLAPMHYFGIADQTDLRSLSWDRSKKDYKTTELSDFYIKAGEKRTRLIINELDKRIDVNQMKAIGFCVSIAHAHFMAEQFKAKGIAAVAVSSEQSQAERERAIQDLAEGRKQIIFAVDIFNEGVDIPSVNTLLLLRPTQSPVLFVQQLGRGLRLSPGKDVCSVFDFIGQQHQEFSFEAKFQALTHKRGPKLVEEVERGFTSTPAGSFIALDDDSSKQVIATLKRLATTSTKKLKYLVREVGTTNLKDFLTESGIPLTDVYRSDQHSWTSLLHDVGLAHREDEFTENERFFLKRLRALLHVNDQERAEMYLSLMDPQGPSEALMDERTKTFARMLIFGLWGNTKHEPPASIDAALEVLRRLPRVRAEFSQILEITVDEARVVPQETTFSPLKSHADYSLGELVGALDDADVSKANNLPREGVRFFKEKSADLFLVTFQKDDNVSATTNYRDYPISPDLIHWESQSQLRLGTETSERYIHHKERNSSILIATRFKRKNEIGIAAAYTLLGEVGYVSHKGEKPIQFEWKLKREMPKALFVAGRTVA